LSRFSAAVDKAIRDPNAKKSEASKHALVVEKAASDLASRRERDRILEKLLKGLSTSIPVVQHGVIGIFRVSSVLVQWSVNIVRASAELRLCPVLCS
jgi:hypothetical protein